MVYERNLRGYTTSLGMCVNLALTSEEKGLVVAKGPKYRCEVTIQLPESKPERWFNLVRTAIAVIEECDRWPVRMNWEHIEPFLTLEELQRIEHSLGDVPFYLYNAPSSCFKFDYDELFRKKRRKKYQNKVC